MFTRGMNFVNLPAMLIMRKHSLGHTTFVAAGNEWGSVLSN